MKRPAKSAFPTPPHLPPEPLYALLATDHNGRQYILSVRDQVGMSDLNAGEVAIDLDDTGKFASVEPIEIIRLEDQ